MGNVFYSNSDNIINIIVSAPIIYLLVIFYIRIIGKRSTSQMNNFDWIVTVAMGSLVSSTIILKDITILDGSVSILVLLLLQYVLNRIMLQSNKIKMLVRSTPQLLLYDGELLEENMRRERILEGEVWAAIRENGLKSKDQVHAVVLETDARLSVIPNDNDNKKCFSLSDVEGLPDGLKDDLKKRGEESDDGKQKNGSDQQTQES